MKGGCWGAGVEGGCALRACLATAYRGSGGVHACVLVCQGCVCQGGYAARGAPSSPARNIPLPKGACVHACVACCRPQTGAQAMNVPHAAVASVVWWSGAAFACSSGVWQGRGRPQAWEGEGAGTRGGGEGAREAERGQPGDEWMPVASSCLACLPVPIPQSTRRAACMRLRRPPAPHLPPRLPTRPRVHQLGQAGLPKT